MSEVAEYELAKGLYHARPEPQERDEADPRLLAEMADKVGLQFFTTCLYECEESVPVGELHIALWPTGDAWGMARFQEGERGATPVHHVKGETIEDVASKLYNLLGFAELDLNTIAETYDNLSEA